MSRKELIAKTLSRITRLRCEGNTENAKTARGILKADFNQAEHELFSQAVREYSGYAGNIHITEAIGHVGVSEIRRKVEQFMKHNEGKPPIVLIDYMQILAPSSERATDKQNVDRNVTELKRISRDYQCPLIGISSFNRENYNEPVKISVRKLIQHCPEIQTPNKIKAGSISKRIRPIRLVLWLLSLIIVITVTMCS